MPPRTGGTIVVDALAANGVDTVFCVPGESFIAVLDALYDAPSIRVVSCRHEAAAAHMAEARGKLDGRPGIAFVTRGPGSTHASIGVHVARQDSTPMILFVGQVARGMRGREAFQELDYAQVFGGLAKWAAEIDDARRIPELVTRAFHVAISGRPGPVVLALPEDVLREEADVADLAPVTRTAAHAGADDLARLSAMLAAAERPLMILGGSGWDEDACGAMRRFAERNALPAACSFRRQALFDNRDPRYAGDLGLGPNPALAARVRDADLILAVGARLGETPTGGYTLIEAPRPKQRPSSARPAWSRGDTQPDARHKLMSPRRSRDQRRPYKKGATKNRLSETTVRPRRKGGIIEAFRRSPLVGADLDLRRPRQEGRKVEL